MLRSAVGAAILGVLGAMPVNAIECSKWSRLGDAEKTETLYRMIQAKLASGEFGEYTSVRHAAVRQCLEQAVPGIRQDFDGTCSQGLSADMEALDRIFEGYVASCIP
ncbi:MAG TPA: hypothetical protein DEP35_21925 [Deltaproteobacteria bacterium]|jgi:hypothetical protein|nr:hypothetical protein [Deltaproteobacteria bacterium]